MSHAQVVLFNAVCPDWRSQFGDLSLTAIKKRLGLIRARRQKKASRDRGSRNYHG